MQTVGVLRELWAGSARGLVERLRGLEDEEFFWEPMSPQPRGLTVGARRAGARCRPPGRRSRRSRRLRQAGAAGAGGIGQLAGQPSANPDLSPGCR
jgi:hypothetical protein